jgi:hypothetical protein
MIFLWASSLMKVVFLDMNGSCCMRLWPTANPRPSAVFSTHSLAPVGRILHMV